MKVPSRENVEESRAEAIKHFFLPGKRQVERNLTNLVSKPSTDEAANEEACHVDADDEGHLHHGGPEVCHLVLLVAHQVPPGHQRLLELEGVVGELVVHTTVAVHHLVRESDPGLILTIAAYLSL